MNLSKETLEVIFESLRERSRATNEIYKSGLTVAIRMAAKEDCDKTDKALAEVGKLLEKFNKLVSPSDVLQNTNEEITDIRAKLMHTLDQLIPIGEIVFGEESPLQITDEEECVRKYAKSASKDQITLLNDTVLSVGDIGTDDLISLIESVYNELKTKK